MDANDVTSWPEPIAGPDGHLFEYSTPTDNSIARRLHFKSPPDFENPMDANRDNVYEVTVRVVDTSNAAGTRNVRITVNNVNEAGKLVLMPEEPHDGMAVTATLTDPDGVEYITDWKWVATGGRVADFAAASWSLGWSLGPRLTCTKDAWVSSCGRWWTTGTVTAWRMTR